MRLLTVVLLFLVAVGVTLFAMGVFTPSEGPTPTPVDTLPPTPPTPEGTDSGLRGAEPAEEPAPEFPRFDQPVRVLLMERWRDPFNVFMEQAFSSHELLAYRTYVQELKPGEKAGASKRETPLADAPGAEALDDVQVVILDQVDPSRIPAAFFEALAEKVRSRSIGLLVMPGLMGGAILDQPSMQGLLPVAKAKKIEGDPVPGVSMEASPFYVTEAGTEHPAARIVPFKDWSEKIWTGHRMGPKSWGTKFVYPIEEVKPGAVVLLEVDVARQGRMPAVIQGSPAEGRVLWVGIPDFGEHFWRDAKSSQKASALVLHWVSWLAGR